MIRWTTHPDYEALSHQAVRLLLGLLRDKPNALVCLASGSTPKRTYELLAEYGVREPAQFAGCRMIKLDEWGGVPMDDPATCEMQLRNQLITPLSLADRYTSFQSDPSEPAAECKRISTWLEDNGPIDLCVLGLGTNGHLGFNEPADMLQPHAHVAQLSDSSLSHAMLSSTHRRPTFGLTLGMADLLNAHAILLLVSGPAKRGPFERLLREEISTAFPASLLHLHPRVTVLCDADACPSNA